jgi:hypothetical protein
VLRLFLFSQLLAVTFSPSQTLDRNVKTKKPNAEQVWKQLDDVLVPRLRLAPIDRAAYCHLLRHTRLEGKLQLRFSMPWLARGICLGPDAASRAVRRLTDHGALRLLECSNAGHVAEVRLPDEILADLPPKVVPAGRHVGIASWMVGMVYHASKEHGQFLLTTYDEFAQGEPTEYTSFPETFEAQTAVLNRAEKRLGSPFRLLSANCEDYVYEVVTGVARSPQREGVALAALILIVIFGGLGGFGGALVKR